MLAFLDKIPYGTPRLRRIVFWLLTVFVLYVLIGFLVAPPVLKSVFESQCRSALGRRGTVERVAFNPLTLRLELDHLAVAKREGEGDLVAVDKIDASAGISSLWKLAPVISHLKLINPRLDITFFGDGRYSVSDLIGKRDPAKRPPEEPEATAVFPFALYGFEVGNATIVFDDRPHHKKHVVSDLNLVVPFTSSFKSLRKEFTQPKFSAVVNGDPVQLTGRTLPFDDTLRTEFKLGAVNVDLRQYWGYLPVQTPLTLESGRFTSELTLMFERPDAQRINLFLGGGGALTALKLRDKTEGAVFSLDNASFQLEKYSLGDNHLTVRDVTLEHPYCKVVRAKNGAINWAGYFLPSGPSAEPPAADNATVASASPQPGSVAVKSAPAPADGVEAKTSDTANNAETVAANATTPTARPKKTAASATGGAFTLDVQRFAVRSGELDWTDRAVDGGFHRVYAGLTLDGRGISTRKGETGVFSGSLGKEETLSLSGSAALAPSPEGNATITGKGLRLPVYRPYYAHALPLVLDGGDLDFAATVTFRPENGVTDVDVAQGTASLTGLALRKPDAKHPSLSLEELAVSGAAVDLKGRDVTVDEIRLKGPDVKLVREKSGEFDLVRLFAADDKGGRAESAPASAPDEPGWTGRVKAVRVTGGAVACRDRSLKHPATLGLHDIALDLDDLTTRTGATVPFRLRAGWDGKGRLDVKGKAELSPVKVEGDIAVRGLGLRPLDGYLGEYTELLFADGAADADLRFAYADGKKLSVSLSGDAALNNVRLKDNRAGDAFAGLEKLEVRGIRLMGEPFRLNLAAINLRKPSVSIAIDKKGESNFRYALRIPQATAGTPDDGAKTSAKTTGTPPTAAQPAPAPTQPETDDVTIGRVTMTGGTVRFHDAGVKPAYTSVIEDMQLTLTDLSRAADAKPKLDFKCRFGPTPMTIIGVCNPLVTPPHVDLAISVNGMEMVPLTPYTLEYLAYPVEKGRLYADVKFRTDAWELRADNKFFIEQLVLGPKDKRPGAPNVPVQFGLSLLQDGNGDMQIDLPIRGRLDDPDFRIGAIVFKAIVNLFFKALASPFSLIGSIFGGGEGDMDFVVFEPGYSNLNDKAMGKLDTIIKALEARKKLKLEVDGVIDPTSDRNGLVKAIFERKLKQQKYEDLPRRERAETTADRMEVVPGEYEKYLYEAYKDEDDPDGVRPTTLFMVDEQPVDVMERFILGRIQVTDLDLEELSVARARAVKDYIISKSPDLTERVFLLDRQKDRKGKTGVPKHRADLGVK